LQSKIIYSENFTIPCQEFVRQFWISMTAAAANAQHEPQEPWSAMGHTVA
jgi:hypothetical protein